MSSLPPDPPSSTAVPPSERDDPELAELARLEEAEVLRLYHHLVRLRWRGVGLLWALVGLPSLWALRQDFALWQHYFAWVSLRYAIVHNRPAALGLGLCVGWLLAVLLWQSRTMIWGLSRGDRKLLAHLLRHKPARGKSSPGS